MGEKELEEARKAGTAAPATDEYGNEISPHIPQYISSTPWYIKQGEGPTLSHQRIQSEQKKTDLNTWYKRGPKKGPVAKKFRKGACTNCGALGHQAKFCLERPRKVNAKHKPVNLAADDAETPNLQLDYDAAHDPWNGYDPTEYQQVFDKYDRLEAERRRINKEAAEKAAKEKAKNPTQAKAKEVKEDEVIVPENAPASVQKFLNDDYEDEDETADADLVLKGDEDQVGTRVDSKARMTIRNLRIREDPAKYLLNLDINSAYYDPKTRSMRANPLPHKDPSQLEFAGDNFVRYTGEAQNFQQLQSFAIEANEKGQPVHMQAAPSQSELVRREFTKKKEILTKQQQQKILERYGGEEHLKAPSKSLLLGQTESYVEYGQDGKLIKGGEKVVLSQWEEDVHPGNHTSVWGSFWSNGKWGYACCYQLTKNAYCLGEAGKKAHETAKLMKQKRDELATLQDASQIEEKEVNKKPKVKEETEAEKKQKILKALVEEEARLASNHTSDRKRSYNSFASCDVSDEQMEAYHIKRMRSEDPMAEYIEAQRKNK